MYEKIFKLFLIIDKYYILIIIIIFLQMGNQEVNYQ